MPSQDEVDIDLDNTSIEELLQGEKPATVERVVTVDEIRSMIGQLSVTEDGEQLRGEMQNLKKALHDNPNACESLLPQDISAMVKELLRLTGRDVEIAAERLGKRGKKKQPQLDLSDPTIKQSILDDLKD